MRKRILFSCSQSFTVISPYTMKTILLLTALTVIMSQSLHAQWGTSGSNIYYNAGNVGIGTAGPGEKLSVSGGNINISNQNYLKTGQMYFQYTNTASNNYVRGIVGQNIIWDPATTQWYVPNTVNPDFSAIRMEASGQIAFYTHPYDTIDYSGNYLTDANMLKYRRLTIAPTGNVGIGTNGPNQKLSVSGGAINVTTTPSQYTLAQVDNTSGSPMGNSDVMGLHAGDLMLRSYWGVSVDLNNGLMGDNAQAQYSRIPSTSSFTINSRSSSTAFTNLFTVRNSGNVGIGTPNPQSLLSVNGTITAKQVTVTQLGWSDYVFEPSYKLRSLPAVESYIQANRHLPDVPSAAEVGKNGVDIGETQASLLRKIEELTLYAIAQEKQLQQNAVDNKAQDNVIKKQQEQLQQQQQLLEQLVQKINLLTAQKK